MRRTRIDRQRAKHKAYVKLSAMLGRVAVAVSLLLIPIVAFPQCNLSQVASVPFRASYLDVAIDGNDLWTATSYGVSLYDRSVDPPALIATLPLAGITRTVRAANGIAYAGSGSTLFVVRKNGRALQLVRGIDAGATVNATINDLLLTTLDLYVATSNGLTQWDLLDPNNPTKTAAVLVTSRANVQSLALSNAILFAADGDSSVESFNIAVPSIANGVGAVTSLPGANAVSVNAGRLYVSDGQQTDIFTNIEHIAFRCSLLIVFILWLTATANASIAVMNGAIGINNCHVIRLFRVLV